MVFGRSEVVGTFGVASATHWLVAQVAMGILERGGNAFDAAVAAGFTSHVVDPHMNGLGGEVVALLKPAGNMLPQVLCGQGTAPAAASIHSFRAEGYELIPDKGLASACVPGCFDAWMLMLRDFGTMEVADVLAPAIAYAEDGFPVSWEVSKFISDTSDLMRMRWKNSAAIYLPGGVAPKPGSILTNRPLAHTLRRLVAESQHQLGPREARVEAARRAFSKGFVADAIDRFVRHYREHDPKTGRLDRGFLTADDLAAWSATMEAAVSLPYRDWQIFKPGPWAQGPVLLQIMALLKGSALPSFRQNSHEFIHLFVEATKLAFADREAWYGDPLFTNVPLDHLLSEPYNALRRSLIGPRASQDLVPGIPPGCEAKLPRARTSKARTPPSAAAAASERDTCHINVIDKWKNVVAATPSGGWLQSSPVIPELGISLSTRAQMFWLEDGLPSSLTPRKRPRTTLSPTIAVRNDGAVLACGCRGADHSDQWLAQFIVHVVDFGAALQEGADRSVFASEHWPNSAFPREALPARLVLDEAMPTEVVESLKAAGHDVSIAPTRKLGRTCAAFADSTVLRAAVTGRLPQAIAIGR
jgi:gamma-glutamyltranspeptidase/glutathione hydrolase